MFLKVLGNVSYSCVSYKKSVYFRRGSSFRGEVSFPRRRMSVVILYKDSYR